MPANDLTYTVKGSFTTTKIKLSACLPPIGSHESYQFIAVHNISKTVGTSQINAILVFMTRTNENGAALSWASTDPLVLMPSITPTTAMVRHTLAPTFNWSAQDTLIIVYHEPVSQTDIDDLQREVPTIYETVQEEGAFSTTWLLHYLKKSGIEKLDRESKILNKMFMFFNPRKAGMTIITKP